MFDIRAIRENPENFDLGWARRGLPAQTPEILKFDNAMRMSQTTLQEAEAARNKNSKLIGQAMSRLRGKADGKLVQQSAREVLSQS